MSKENKYHIGIYGRRNVGKSSLINFLTNQQVAIVSEEKGTTTDPVKRSFEILDLGAAIFIDTAGVDDTGELGQSRIERTFDTIRTIDLAILVIDYTNNIIIGKYEQKLISQFEQTGIPYIIVINKADLIPHTTDLNDIPYILVSTKNGTGRETIIETITKTLPKNQPTSLMGDLINKGDVVLLITPIDSEAPQGRLILPQVTAIRDILNNNAIAIVLKETEVEYFLANKSIKPTLAITDSQLFKLADKLIPKDIPLTSFSILMARMKGNFEVYLQGVQAISNLQDGNRVLMLENCSHQTSCDDIGRVKIPAMLRKFTGKHLNFDIVEGLDKLTRVVSDYALVIQCGGCMATRKQLVTRIKPIVEAGIPVTNYGMAIAYTQGVFERATAIFKSNKN